MINGWCLIGIVTMAGEIEEPVSFSFQVDFFHNFFFEDLIFNLCFVYKLYLCVDHLFGWHFGLLVDEQNKIGQK